MNGTLDPKQLRLDRGSKQVFSSRERKSFRYRRIGRFIKGPIPLKWLTIAAKQRGKALHVAVGLWFWSGVKRSREVRLSISWLLMLGVKRTSGYRGLAALEQAGLVSVVRHPGRNPIVTLLDVAVD